MRNQRLTRKIHWEDSGTQLFAKKLQAPDIDVTMLSASEGGPIFAAKGADEQAIQFTSLLKKRRSTKAIGDSNSMPSEQGSEVVAQTQGLQAVKKEVKTNRKTDEKGKSATLKKLSSKSSFIVVDTVPTGSVANVQTEILPEDDVEVSVPDAQQKEDTIQHDSEWRTTIEDIITSGLKKHKLFVSKLTWFSQRVEITVQGNDPSPGLQGGGGAEMEIISPSSLDIQNAHASIYQEFEVREDQLKFNSRYEMIVASPGIGDSLRSDRDFESFKGFTVTVKTSEIFKKKDTFEGSLISRSQEFVTIANRGRLQNIPRKIVAEVKLPKSKIEPSDIEMRKLSA